MSKRQAGGLCQKAGYGIFVRRSGRRNVNFLERFLGTSFIQVLYIFASKYII